MRIDGNRLPAYVAPADDAPGVVRDELRIAKPQVARNESGRLVKACSWYDNEWGFSNRMLDVTTALMRAK
jgi:glyceraldehyde-3-phosphate dehydrogenase/erythrose-4-phosphate dehydrogenase